MKTPTSKLTRGLLLLAAVGIISFASSGAALADDHHDAWSHDHDGYWDSHNVHHAYIMHENHHGYWRDRDNGPRIFINID